MAVAHKAQQHAPITTAHDLERDRVRRTDDQEVAGLDRVLRDRVIGSVDQWSQNVPPPACKGGFRSGCLYGNRVV